MKTLAVIVCLLICFNSDAQLSVDSIKTNDDVIELIYKVEKQYDLVWPYYYGNDTVHKRILDTLYAKWLIEDFNNDGRKDFVFNGFIDNKYSLFSLLSNGLNSYTYFNLSKEPYKFRNIESYKSRPVKIQTTFNDSSRLLVIKGYKTIFKTNKWALENRIDTLKSFAGGFIEWKSGKKKPIQLESLEIEIEPTGMSSDMLSPNKQILLISNQKKITYKRIVSAYNRSGGTDDLNVEYTSAVDDNMKQSLLELLTEMDLSNMQDSFEVGALHQTEARIKIKTPAGTKNIYDYGLEGSYGLRMLYKQLFALMKLFKANASKYLTNYDYLFIEQ